MSAQVHWLAGLRLSISRPRALALLALFVVVQIADGWLTASGIDRYGVAAEANPMLALALTFFGPAAALTIAKGAAVVGAVALYQFSRHTLLATLTAMYVVVAIAPWAWALGIA